MEIDFEKIKEKYKTDVEQINFNMKKKYFNFTSPNKGNKKISFFDDMYDILYKTNKEHDLSNYDFSNNIDIYQDIIKLCKMIFGLKYFDDNDFKCVKSHDELNYLNPKEDESIIYNSLRKTIFQQSEFRKDIYIFEDKIKKLTEHYDKYNKNYTIRINFYEDEEYEPLVWMIIEIK